MATLAEHLIRFTDHRDRSLLELTLAKALVDLTRIQRVVISHVITTDNGKRWLDSVMLDARGGGKVADPLRTDFAGLPRLEDAPDRARCLREGQRIELAWAGENGPRNYYLPLFDDARAAEEPGVLELHAPSEMNPGDEQVVQQLLRVYRNMHAILAYSDRDALTGLFNRKSLDDTFYSAVLEELEGMLAQAKNGRNGTTAVPAGQERRHRVPPNYWIGSIVIDGYKDLADQHGHLAMEEVTLLVARLMNNTFRTHDRLYRFANQEFAVLMHCPDEALALGAFERMRANVEKFNFPQAGRVTISASFTRVQAEDTPGIALARNAEAIRHLQKSGGNQACSYPELVRQGVLIEPARAGAMDVA